MLIFMLAFMLMLPIHQDQGTGIEQNKDTNSKLFNFNPSLFLQVPSKSPPPGPKTCQVTVFKMHYKCFLILHSTYVKSYLVEYSFLAALTAL